VIPDCSGPGPALAAQRNYLASLHAELADTGVCLGMLYIGATIENSAFHTSLADDPDGGGSCGPRRPLFRIVDAHTGGLLRDLPPSFADVRWLSGQRLRKLCGQRLSGESHGGTIG
jgi:hypothetical protein